jgi:hypothetical protein
VLRGSLLFYGAARFLGFAARPRFGCHAATLRLHVLSGLGPDVRFPAGLPDSNSVFGTIGWKVRCSLPPDESLARQRGALLLTAKYPASPISVVACSRTSPRITLGRFLLGSFDSGCVHHRVGLKVRHLWEQA